MGISRGDFEPERKKKADRHEVDLTSANLHGRRGRWAVLLNKNKGNKFQIDLTDVENKSEVQLYNDNSKYYYLNHKNTRI